MIGMKRIWTDHSSTVEWNRCILSHYTEALEVLPGSAEGSPSTLVPKLGYAYPQGYAKWFRGYAGRKFPR